MMDQQPTTLVCILFSVFEGKQHSLNQVHRETTYNVYIHIMLGTFRKTLMLVHTDVLKTPTMVHAKKYVYNTVASRHFLRNEIKLL